MKFRFPLTIFLSAFLLFQVQPLIGRYILPWFGGGPAVWTSCLLFFQALLLAGYAYAHWIGSRSGRRLQAGVHLLLLAVSLAWLPIGPAADLWKPAGSQAPTARILLLLLANIGGPYLVLSSTAPLLQRWFHTTFPGRSVYRLYALSNFGSLLALLSYPFVFEPSLTLGHQSLAWSAGYAGFAILCAWVAIRYAWVTAPGDPAPAPADTSAPGQAPKPVDILLWLALAACGSALLMATTNQMSQEVAVVPFLWVLPLAVYLVTFMIAFEKERWYSRRIFGMAAGVLVSAAAAVLTIGPDVPLWVQVSVDTLVLFVCAMICHGELARTKPAPRHLTLFYLVMAAGGALGGLLVAVVAPKTLHDYREFPISLAAASVLGLAVWMRQRAWESYPGRWQQMLAPVAGLVLAAVGALYALDYNAQPDTVAIFRNFYGVMRVTEDETHPPKRLLTHGRIIHGFQFQEESKRRWATSYFGPESGVGMAILHHPRRQEGLRVGVVGLGVGTIAAFGRTGDTYRFYEINPEVLHIANRYFTFLKDCPAKVDVVLGDARVELERQAARGDFQNFDVLAVDAFSSDAIPAHLLTAECLEVYRKHLGRDGILLFHVSNRSLDLSPVVRGLARSTGWTAAKIVSAGKDDRGTYGADWVAVTARRDFLDLPVIAKAVQAWNERDRHPLLWTDDFTSLWQILKL